MGGTVGAPRPVTPPGPHALAWSSLLTGFEAEPVPGNTSTNDEWEANLAALRRRFPDAGSDGILFCVHKLQQDPELTLKDFRDEARLYGLTLGGRSLHSAKVLLGLEKPAVRRKKSELQGHSSPQRDPIVLDGEDGDGSMESNLIQAVQQIQEAATADAQRLRTAMHEAIRILREALHGRPGDHE